MQSAENARALVAALAIANGLSFDQQPVSQYDWLRATYDPDREKFRGRSASEFEKPRALINRLDLAEDDARGDIAMAAAAGNNVTQQIPLDEQAEFLREGIPANKLDARRRFWNASLETRLLTVFSRQFELKRQPSGWRWRRFADLGGLLTAGRVWGWRYGQQRAARRKT